MKDTSKIVILLSLLWLANTRFIDDHFLLIVSTLLFGLLLSAYRYFILKAVVYKNDKQINTLIEFIESRKEE